jgi:hypothetical protein
MIDYYNKYLKYKEKYISLKNIQNGGFNQKTYYVKTDEDDFNNDMKEALEKRNYKESDIFPVNFVFLSGESAFYKNKIDIKQSEWISILYGKSKKEITDKTKLKKKFGKERFFINGDIININDSIPKYDKKFVKIMKPLGGFAGAGIKIVQSNDEISDWIKSNPKYNDWVIEDYIINPDLIDGYKFHFRVLVLVKVENKKIEVYISNNKYYVKALEKYKKGDYENKNIHDTHYKKMKIDIFPNVLPDNWNEKDANNAINDMEQIITKIFKNEKEFYPEWKAKKGFEIFGADFIFENKHTYLLEINEKMSLKGRTTIVEGIVSTVLYNNPDGYFKKLI